jgi:hypothetical protein
MAQQVLVYFTLVLALVYLGRKLYSQFLKPEKACGSHCTGCGQIDFEKISESRKKASQAL